MEKDITEIKVHLAEIKIDLKHHMKRTELLEDEVREWRKDIEPVQEHITVVTGIGRLLGLLAIIAGGIAAVISLY